MGTRNLSKKIQKTQSRCPEKMDKIDKLPMGKIDCEQEKGQEKTAET